MEFITYYNSYTEFLVPKSNIKVVVYNDGSGRVEDMMDKTNGVVFSNGNTDNLMDELAEVKADAKHQFQAKWDAWSKLDDYRDAIDQLRADNEKLTKQLDNAQCDKVAAMNAGKGWMVKYNDLRRKNFELVQCIEDGIVCYKEG